MGGGLGRRRSGDREVGLGLGGKGLMESMVSSDVGCFAFSLFVLLILLWGVDLGSLGLGVLGFGGVTEVLSRADGRSANRRRSWGSREAMAGNFGGRFDDGGGWQRRRLVRNGSNGGRSVADFGPLVILDNSKQKSSGCR